MCSLVPCMSFLFLCIHCQIHLHLFVIPLVASKFDLLPKILHELFLVSSPIGECITTERVHRNCPITILDRVTYADLIELTMLDFDILLGMDCLHKYYATIDCRNRVVRFQFHYQLELEWDGVVQMQQAKQFSILKPIRCHIRGIYTTQSEL